MNDHNYYLLVFSSHNQAVYLYNWLIKKGYPVELVSTPCKISSGCTQSIKFGEEYMNDILYEANIVGTVNMFLLPDGN